MFNGTPKWTVPQLPSWASARKKQKQSEKKKERRRRNTNLLLANLFVNYFNR